MSTLFSPAFLWSLLARLIHRHPDQNTTADFQNASETLSFRQLPHVTASRPLPHEETSCVQQLRRKFQCGLNQPPSSVQLLVCFVADFTFSLSPRTPQRTRNSEPANCRQLSLSRPGAQDSLHASASHTHVSDLSQICCPASLVVS